MNIRFSLTVFVTGLTLMLGSCGGSPADNGAIDVTLTAEQSDSETDAPEKPVGQADTPVADTPKPSIKEMDVSPRDSSLYQMGQRHAADLLENYTDDDDLGERLLEIRAREANIRTRVDNDAADAYLYGFTSYIADRDPVMATRLF